MTMLSSLQMDVWSNLVFRIFGRIHHCKRGHTDFFMSSRSVAVFEVPEFTKICTLFNSAAFYIPPASFSLPVVCQLFLTKLQSVHLPEQQCAFVLIPQTSITYSLLILIWPWLLMSWILISCSCRDTRKVSVFSSAVPLFLLCLWRRGSGCDGRCCLLLFLLLFIMQSVLVWWTSPSWWIVLAMALCMCFIYLYRAAISIIICDAKTPGMMAATVCCYFCCCLFCGGSG